MAETLPVKPNVSHIKVIISAIFAILAWTSSFSILFPLFICLIFSKRCSDRFFSWMYPLIMSRLGPYFEPSRKKLFEHLPADPSRNIKVLEVGVGHGANFDFYPSNCELTLLDMNKNFEMEIGKKLKNHPNLKVEKIIFGMAEDMKGIPDRAYDIVICTYLLCSVRDVTAVLKEVSRVLKPDGKFLYLEHVAFPVSAIPRWTQILINPIWRIYNNGCNVNRPTYNIISQAFVHNSFQISYPLSLPLYVTPQALGVASHPRLS